MWNIILFKNHVIKRIKKEAKDLTFNIYPNSKAKLPSDLIAKEISPRKFIPGYIPLKEARGTTIGNYLMEGEGERVSNPEIRTAISSYETSSCHRWMAIVNMQQDLASAAPGPVVAQYKFRC